MGEVKELENYAITGIENEQIAEIIQANLGPTDGLSRFDLDKCKVPAGGQTRWEVPTLEGVESKEALAGIIIHWKDVRAFWEEEYTGGNTPPDCYSDDTIQGIGNPGGKCESCPFSEWGSAEEGDGQKCKQMRILFILREDDILPMAITAPPTSVRNLKQYFMRLASKAIPFYGVKTSLELKKATNNSGIEYSEIDPSFVEKLSSQAVSEIKEYRSQIKPRLEEVRIEDREDVTDIDNTAQTNTEDTGSAKEADSGPYSGTEDIEEE